MQRKIVKTVQFENTEQDLQWRPLTKADQLLPLGGFSQAAAAGGLRLGSVTSGRDQGASSRNT